MNKRANKIEKSYLSILATLRLKRPEVKFITLLLTITKFWTLKYRNYIDDYWDDVELSAHLAASTIELQSISSSATP